MKIVDIAFLVMWYTGQSLTVRGSHNILPDALSRLNAAETTKVRDDEDTLDDLVMSNAIEFVTTAYGTTMLTEIQDNFRRQLQTGYDEDKHFSQFKTLAQKHPDSTAFAWRDDLLWFNERLCIPKTLVGDIFQTVHDEQYHVGYHRIYPRLQGQFYIRKLDKLLRRYLQHCPECQEVQTKRHRPFGALQPIFSPAIPFHTITIDFILGLPEVNDFNSILSVTCKFSKRVILLPGHDTYTASAWGHRLLDELLSADWGLPTVIISERDPKFLSQVWKTIFDRLGTKLLRSTAHHPQSDGQSERTNQTAEAAIRYFLTWYPGRELEWHYALPHIRFVLNNSLNQSTVLERRFSALLG